MDVHGCREKEQNDSSPAKQLATCLLPTANSNMYINILKLGFASPAPSAPTPTANADHENE